MRVRIGILIYILTSIVSLSQELNFKNFDLEDGLVQVQISSILEDSRGFIWFGTYGGGLSRFNGQYFKVFDRRYGLTNERVISIYEDKEKYLWVGTYSGVFRFDGIKFEKMKPSDGFPEGMVRTITSRINGEIWFTDTKKSVVIYKNGKILNNPELSILDKKFVVSICPDSHGDVWIGTNTGLMRYSKGKLEKIPIKLIPGSINVRVVFVDSKDRIWVGSKNKLFLKNRDIWSEFTKKDGLNSTEIWAINELSNGLISFGTKQGLSLFDGKSFKSISEKQGLINNFVTSIIEDRDKNIWIGTDGGISKQISWFPFTAFSKRSGLKDNNVVAFSEDIQGYILISSDKGINRFSYGAGKIENLIAPYADKVFSASLKDREGFTWFGIQNTIFQTKNGKIIKKFDRWEKNFQFITDIYQDSRSRIWFGTNSGGIKLYENGKFINFSNEKLLNSNLVTSFIEDEKKRIWIGMEGELLIYNGENFRKPIIPDLPNRFSITKILRDKYGKLWVGTYDDGLILIDPSSEPFKVTSFNYPKTLPEKNILSMIFDKTGNLWAGTNIGFFKLSVGDYLLKRKDFIRQFSGETGAIDVKCNENAIFCDRTGNIWLGTHSGVITFSPGKISDNYSKPIIQITDVDLSYQRENITQYCNGFIPGSKLPNTLILPFDKNHISFKFIGVTTSRQKNLFYRWKLEPDETEWSSPLKQSQVTYSNLSPGNYRFFVKCSNNPREWDIGSASFDFSIEAPFWKRSLFLYLLASILALVAFFSYFFKSRSIKKKEAELQEKIKMRTEELRLEKIKVEQINIELENRVQERTKELEQKSKQLEQAQKMEVIGTLAGGVAHDLNNILAGIVSYPDLLLKQIPDDSPYRKYVEIIKNSGEKAAEMVQDLLTLTRKGVVNKEPVSVNEIIREFLNGPLFEKLRKNHPHISYISNLTDEKTFILGSSIHITKAIMNLVINASEALPIDGKIEMTTKRCFLDKPLKGYNEVVEGEYIQLSIKDTGIGIDEKDIESIFEPFFSKKRMGRSGTGLGMTVVWWTVKDHSGYIVVNSIRGKGTEFALYFPSADYNPEAEKPDEEMTLKSGYFGRGEHILIVEDDDNNRQLAEEILSQFNYKVSSVSSGEEAVKFVQKEDVDLLILDMIMDGINGLETYIRILMRKGEQKAIITSGYSENELVKEAIKLGAGCYIKKPYLKMQLLQAVEAELRKI